MQLQLQHLGLCEGIGGFSYAASLVGWSTVAWCEIDPYCQWVLNKNFPHAKGYSDVFDFPGHEWAGKIDVLTAGFPCQPYSVAGKRLGGDDDRAIWPQIARIIGEVRPAWVVLENVAGIRSMEQPERVVVVEGGSAQGVYAQKTCAGIIEDLRGLGYDFPRTIAGDPIIFGVPACAVGALHERDRTWFVAHASGAGRAQRDVPAVTNRTGHYSGGIVEDDADAKGERWAQRLMPTIGTGTPLGTGGIVEDDADAKGAKRQRAGNTWTRRAGHTDACCAVGGAVSDADRKRKLQPKGSISKVGGRDRNCGFQSIADPDGQRRENGRQGAGTLQKKDFGCQDNSKYGDGGRGHGESVPWQPNDTADILREAYGLPRGMDGVGALPSGATPEKSKSAGRAHRIKALGNAIVPQVAVHIFKAIINAEQEQQN